MTASVHTPDDGHHGVEALLLHDHPRAVRFVVLLWIVAGTLFIAMAIPPVRDAIYAFDEQLYDWTYPIKWGPLTVLAYGMNFIGSAWFVWPLRVVITIYLSLRRRWAGLAVWLVAAALSDPFIGVLKAAYGRPRPPEALVDSVTAAFPSGHATAGAVVALSLVIIFVPAGPPRRNLEIAAAGFAFVMAGSRVYLGAHWFTDVVAGVAFGAASAIVAAIIVERFRSVPRISEVAASGYGATGSAES